MFDEEEKWVVIEGYERYEISTYGRIKSYCKLETRFITPYSYKENNLLVWLTRDHCKPKSELLCYLVAKAFVPNPNNYKHVRFLDGDKNNCRADNLEWVKLTDKQMQANADKVKSVNQLSLDGSILKTYSSADEASKETGIAKSVLTNACLYGGTAGGFKWSYATKDNRKLKYKPIRQLDRYTGEVLHVFNSPQEAACFFGKDPKSAVSSISMCCKGRTKTAYGYKWEYDDYCEFEGT